LTTSGDSNIEARIAEAVKAREDELKVIHEQEVQAAADAAFRRFKQPSTEKILAAGLKQGERLFAEKWEKYQADLAANGESTVPREVIDKAVEDAVKKKEDEFNEKLQKATEGARNEAEIRNKLQLSKLQKQAQDAKAKLEAYEKQASQTVDAAQSTPQPAHTTPATQTQPPQQQTPNTGPQGAAVLQKLQAGRGAGIPRPNRGGAPQQGIGRGRGGQPQGQRLSGQHPAQQQAQNQGQRPAVNRPVPAGAPGTGQPHQRRQSLQQQQSQLPRPQGGLNVGAAPFQPGIKRPREDEGQGGQGNQAAGQKRSRVNSNPENGGTDGQV